MFKLWKRQPKECEKKAKQLAARVENMRTDATETMMTMTKNIRDKKCKKAHT